MVWVTGQAREVGLVHTSNSISDTIYTGKMYKSVTGPDEYYYFTKVSTISTVREILVSS